jgi:thiol-disulfide isomerase/thioredoxin
VVCLRKLPVSENGSLIESYVELVNATVLHTDVLWINSSIKTRSTPSNCSIVLFYAHWCPFSAKAAPHFNALPLAFPHLRVAAIDSTEHSSVNSFFGILSVPTILLFHNGKTVAKFNDTSLTLDKFAAFIHAFTDLRSAENFNLTSVPDNRGPLSSVATETRDVWLYLAWIFIVLCFFHYAAKSTLWKKVSDLVRTTWREAEAQHEHTD